ncbi:MAG TPA: FtsK/SpoIIIE domain-containing protein [Pirellulales bacterium]|jgi:ABC-type multidrug transport system fused ATPase/permease subunit
MSPIRVVEREKRVLETLVRLVDDRVQAEQVADASYRAGEKEITADFQRASAEITARYQAEAGAAERAERTARETLIGQWKAHSRKIEESSQDAAQRMVNDINRAERKAHKAVDEARWLARTVFEASRKRMSENIAELQQQLRSRLRTTRGIETDAIYELQRLGHRSIIDQTVVPPPDDDVALDHADLLGQSLETAKAELQALRALKLPDAVRSANAAWIFMVVAALTAPAVAWLSNGSLPITAGVTLVLTAGAGVGLTIWLRGVARRQTAARFRPLLASVKQAETSARRYLEKSAANYKRKRAEIRRQRDTEYARATEQHAPVLATCKQRREVELPKLTEEADQHLVTLQRRLDEELAKSQNVEAQQKADARQRYEQAMSEAQAVKERRLASNQAEFERARTTIALDWQAGYTAAQGELAAINQEIDHSCPPWDIVTGGDWRPQRDVPKAIRFGDLTLDLRARAAPVDAENQDLVFKLPALLDFPGGTSIFIKTQGEGRRRAIALFQVVLLRLLTAVPPGKVRLTIVDPVGLGQNFAAFMHLADHDEALVNHRIWTEPVQIEQRLADLTEHIETVIQKYLRNEFPTIEAYNEAAGEVAEAFRVLVVANFPAGFTEASARRLLSIAASGPRCGVQVLVSVDTKQPALPGISLADLQKHATVFTISGNDLAWQEPDFKELPLVVDNPPTEECKAVLNTVGAAAHTAKRVEVPFEAIAPPDDAYWKGDSRRGIDVPLGRAGATRLQHLRLGHGTSQHVLIAGKTGSGKSTLLHALITNAALRYSPDEIELYLIDFKKGVEFKTYVTHELPHARVIAIESEREFGLSVMQRLDAEMRERGERFREAGVQDIAGFRDSGEILPRILFIVDEFQEFFVEDDKVAQEASLLLDRLVRQGRAFGIHVHLGSQTLGGAYSLARTTLGQMAVRIALQCAESDAHLILSEENSAARLLSRPGEAIYNDANGMVEGNHPFQVVWLPDERRDVFLDEVTKLNAQRPPRTRRQQIVFEGTRPADMEKSETLAALIATASSTPPAVLTQPSVVESSDALSEETIEATGGPSTAAVAPLVWLGEPLAIQSATSVTFTRRGGSNLLMIGQNDDAAAGMFISSIISLASQFPIAGGNGQPASASFTILNGALPDRDYVPLFAKLPRLLPGQVRLVPANDTSAALAELAAEVESRHSGAVDTGPRFLFVFDLPRMRELRKQEEDFSFSRSAEETPKRPDQHFADILRDGAPVGIHTIVWCDSLTNFQRMLERQGLKEFDTRLLLQMSAADSSLLMDTPAASFLGKYRALLHREDEGRLEKFRPYSPPSENWLATTCDQITAQAAPTAAPLTSDE